MVNTFGAKRLFTAVCGALACGTPPSIAFALTCAETNGLAVDADGAPDSYRVDGNGLSHTCDGVFAIVQGIAQSQKNNPSQWQQLCTSAWALAKRTGDYSHVKIVGFLRKTDGSLLIQGVGDPLPGLAYVTKTKLPIPGQPKGSQRQFVNASEIPYVVVSSAFVSTNHIIPGDIVLVYRQEEDKYAFAVYGDCCSMDEGPVRLHADLGSNPIIIDHDGIKRAKAGIGGHLFFVALPHGHTHPSLNAEVWRKEINEVGERGLDEVGGILAVRACAASHVRN